MEGDYPTGDKAQYKPPGYKQLIYAPKLKVQTEADLAKIKKDKLEKAYTIWVYIREQMFQKKKQQDYDPNELQEIESFDTVSNPAKFELCL